jgi:ABC-type glycerol-3-phosphate transport system substrate-binding protein
MAQSENPDLLDNIGIFAFPAGPSEDQDPADTVGDAKSICLIKSTDENKAAASKAFLMYFMEPETQANRANTRPVFAIPSTNSAFNSEVYQSNAMVQKFSEETQMLFDEVIPYTYRTGGEGGLNPRGGSIEATMIIGNAIQNVLLEGWTVDQAVDWIDEQISFYSKATSYANDLDLRSFPSEHIR